MNCPPFFPCNDLTKTFWHRAKILRWTPTTRDQLGKMQYVWLPSAEVPCGFEIKSSAETNGAFQRGMQAPRAVYLFRFLPSVQILQADRIELVQSFYQTDSRIFEVASTVHHGLLYNIVRAELVHE